MKGKTTIGELMSLPNRIFHTLYHNHYLFEESRQKREKAENAKVNNGNKNKNITRSLSKKEMNEFEDELEEIGWEGLV